MLMYWNDRGLRGPSIVLCLGGEGRGGGYECSHYKNAALKM